MTENEQIEEMARDMCEYFYEGRCYLDKKECDCKCAEFKDAQYLYAKGYRKIERGEWITPWVMKPYGKAYGTPYCSVCKQIDGGKGNFCGFCGADMRGEK